MFNRLKQKKCKNCKYKFEDETLFCCKRPIYQDWGPLRPLKLICFHFRKGGKDGNKNSDNRI